jgi:hypothetical protein
MNLNMLFDFIQVLLDKRKHSTKMNIFLNIIIYYDLFTTKTKITS